MLRKSKAVVLLLAVVASLLFGEPRLCWGDAADDAVVAARIVGCWASKRHDYSFQADGVWMRLGGAASGSWSVMDGLLYWGEGVYRIAFLDNHRLVLERGGDEFIFYRVERDVVVNTGR